MAGWLEFLLFVGLFIVLGDIRSDIASLQKQITKLINDITDINYSIDRGIDKARQDIAMLSESTNPNGKQDILLYEACKYATQIQNLSVSSIQRHFTVNFARANRIIEQMYNLGIVGDANENGVRRCLLDSNDIELMSKSGVFG